MNGQFQTNPAGIKVKVFITFCNYFFLFVVLHEAESYRHRSLADCTSIQECRKAAERLREIFLKHPVSAKYYDDSLGNDHRPSDIDSIFKWG